MTRPPGAGQRPAQRNPAAAGLAARTVAVQAGTLIGEIITLADRASRTLGFLPRAALLERVFLDRPRGERRADFVARLRELSAPLQWERALIRDPTGQAVVLYAWGQRDGELVIPMIRISPTPLGATIARQLLLLLRQQCRTLGVNCLRIADPFRSELVAAAALDERFREHHWDLLAFVVEACEPAAAISQQLSRIGEALDI